MNLSYLTPILLATCAALASADEPASSPVERFQSALALEESQGDAGAALAIYRELVTTRDTPAALRVRAELRVAACYERLGQPEEARKRFTELASLAGTWESVAKAARAGVARLAPSDEASPLPKGWLSSWDPTTKRLHFSVKDADVRALLCELARIGGLNLVLAPTIMGSVTTELQRVSPRRAIEAIVETVGHYSLVEVEGILRVVTKGSLDRQLVTKVYRLRPKTDELRARLADARTPQDVAAAARALVVHQEHHRSLTRVVSELLVTSSVPGVSAGYDGGTEAIFVRCGRNAHAAVRKALARELAPPQPAPRSADPLVSAQFVDASADHALTFLARAAKSPIVLTSQVTGNVTLVLKDVPVHAALRAVTETLGDYLMIRTPIGPRVTTREASEARTTLRRWPLSGDGPRFWRFAHAELREQGKGRWPGHPLTRLLSAIVVSANEPGAEVQYDPGSHALLCNLSDGLAADLRQALETAGYLPPVPRPALEPGERYSNVNLRLLLQKIAARHQVNVIVSPAVRGRASAVLPKQARAHDLLEQIAMATGDYVVEAAGPDLFRVATRAGSEFSLSTEVVSIPRLHLAPADLFAAVNQLVVASQIAGSSVLCSRSPEGAWSLVVTLPSREQALLGKIVEASVPRKGFRKSMIGQCLLIPGGTKSQAFTVQAEGAHRVRRAVYPEKPGEQTTLDGWTLRLLPDHDRTLLLLAEKGRERRVERTSILPPRPR